MSDWNEGYVTSIDYTHGYYPELSPLRAKLALANAKVLSSLTSNPGTACELGFGQGVSIAVHAAATATSWYGTDFNPSQAALASELVRESGSSARIFDESFKEFCGRQDLPDFDFIGLHGIWSWVSNENRAVLVDFIRRKLKVGGVLYVSYNTQPGWAAFMPLRDLLVNHVNHSTRSSDGVLSQISEALSFADDLMQVKPKFLTVNPQISERLQQLKGQSREYLAHEYFNKDWRPMSFVDMTGWLTDAKLSYACSASYSDNIDALNLTPEQKDFLDKIKDETIRESVRDFLSNQQFRRDYWVKGPRQYSELRRLDAIAKARVVLVISPEDFSLNIQTGLGKLKMHERIYQPIVNALRDFKPMSLVQLENALSENGITRGQLVEAISVMIAKNDISIVQDDPLITKAKSKTEKLNSHLLSMARSNETIGVLASPVTGGAVAVPRFHQLYLLAHRLGHTSPEAISEYVWSVLSAQNQRMIHEGKSLLTKEEHMEHLKPQAMAFLTKRLPILQGLQV